MMTLAVTITITTEGAAAAACAVAGVHGEDDRQHQGRGEYEPNAGLLVLLWESVPPVLHLKPLGPSSGDDTIAFV